MKKNKLNSRKMSTARLRRNAGRVAQLLKAVGNENRLMVLCALAQGELSVGELNTKVDLSQSALSQHLAKLRRDNLVTTRKESQTVYYSLASKDAANLLSFLYENYCS